MRKPFNTVPRRTVLKSALWGLGCGGLEATAETSKFATNRWHGNIAGFTLTDIAGKVWRNNDWEGRAVLLNFWATWCPPCRAEMPSLQQIADFYGRSLLVLAINVKEPPTRVQRFAQDTGNTLPLLLDATGELSQRWGVRILPTTLAISRQGKPQWRLEGEMDWASPHATTAIEGLLR